MSEFEKDLSKVEKRESEVTAEGRAVLLLYEQARGEEDWEIKAEKTAVFVIELNRLVESEDPDIISAKKRAPAYFKNLYERRWDIRKPEIKDLIMDAVYKGREYISLGSGTSGCRIYFEVSTDPNQTTTIMRYPYTDGVSSEEGKYYFETFVKHFGSDQVRLKN